MEIVPQETNTQNIAGLAKKLATVMGQLNRIPKRGKNAHFNYDYVSESDLLDTIRPLLAAQFVFIVPSVVSATEENFETRIELLFTIVDGETGATMHVTWFSEAQDKQDKGISKAVTLGLKYFLKAMFLVSTGDPMDDPDSGMDGEKEDKKPEEEKKATTSTSSKKATTTKKVEAPPTPEPSPLDDLRKNIHTKLGKLSDDEIARLAGISKFNDLNEWRKKYVAIGDAFAVVESAYLKPAEPKTKGDSDAVTRPFGSAQTGKSNT